MKILRRTLSLILCTVVASNTIFAQDEQAKPNREKFVVDEVVAVVGSSPILLSELVNTEDYLRQNYMQKGYSSTNLRGEALESLLTQRLLMTQAALDSLVVNEAAIEQQAESQLQSLIEHRGSAKELEKFYNKPIFAIKEIIRTKTRESEMANTMQSTAQGDVEVTPADVQRFYRKANKDSLPIVPDQYVVSKIEIKPSKDENRKLDVKEEVLNLRKRIMEGADFGVLARMYSDDLSSAVKGGEMQAMPVNTFELPFADAVTSTPVGQLSQVVETKYGYHLLEVLEQRGDQYRVRHILRMVKFDAEEKYEAKQKLDSLAREIRIDSLKFEDAVAEFSQDEISRVNKGMMTNTVYEDYGYGAKYKSFNFSKEDLGTLYQHISKLKVGDVSDAFEYVNEMSRDESVMIVRLEKIIPSHTANIKDDYTMIEELTTAEKRNKKFNDWLSEKIDDIYVKIEPQYRDIELKDSRWKK